MQHYAFKAKVAKSDVEDVVWFYHNIQKAAYILPTFFIMKQNKEIAYFGAGCFWHVELEFSKFKGVLSTKVGYMGGKESDYSNPSYEEVCTDKTGHAETVQIIFNPKLVTYQKLLDLFWKLHDPTTMNRQGPDVGSQYRSVIFYTSEQQRTQAEQSKQNQQKKIGKKIVTEIIKAGKFHIAENYHQKYLEKRGLNVC